MHPKALLEAATELVRLSLKFDHPTDAVVARFFREHRSLGPRERATLTDTVYAVLRYKLRFDHFSPSAPTGSGAKERRLAMLGLWHTSTSHDFLFAAVSEAEKNWLIECGKVKPGDLLERHQHNLPEWLVEPLKAQLETGSHREFWPLVESLNQTAPLDVRVNVLTEKRDAVQKELAQAKIESTPTPYSPWGLRIKSKTSLGKESAYTRGAIEVQDEGSQLLALLLDAKRGEMVVDFCAGAGGKTLAIGATMRNTGRLYAFDTSAHRLDALKPRLARSGLSNVHPVAIAHERDERIKRLAGKIDRVLVDAPCSGLGTLRRNPALKWRQTPALVEAQTKLQAEILQSAARLLKPGGRLVYATCSLLTQENEAIAQSFSQAHRDFKALPVGDLLTQLKVPQATSLCSGGEGPEAENQLYLRLWPHRHHTDGFFAAVWEKI